MCSEEALRFFRRSWEKDTIPYKEMVGGLWVASVPCWLLASLRRQAGIEDRKEQGSQRALQKSDGNPLGGFVSWSPLLGPHSGSET